LKQTRTKGRHGERERKKKEGRERERDIKKEGRGKMTR
jgi:hypothetical protein